MVRRMGGRVSLLLAVLVTVSSLTVPAPARGRFPPAPVAENRLETRPYLFRPGASSVEALPLDPSTLRGNGSPVEIALPEMGYYRWWCRSGDGSTIAVDEGGEIVVRDTAMLAERHRFPLEMELYRCALSRDGGRLVLTTISDRQLSAAAVRWLTYDLGTGALVSDIAGVHAGDLEYRIDPAGRSLYQLQWEYPDQPGDSGPKHPTLVAYDLDAGRPRTRLVLHDVVGGGWWEGIERAGTDEQFPVMYAPAGHSRRTGSGSSSSTSTGKR